MKWYRGIEVAEILGISHTTFKNYQLDYFKRIKGVKKENGLYLYNDNAIKEIKKEIGHKKIQKKTQNKIQTNCIFCKTKLNKLEKNIGYCIQCDKYFKNFREVFFTRSGQMVYVENL